MTQRKQTRWRQIPRPFLKWAGGKQQLLAQLDPLFPRSFGRYFEPFLGGGAVFFHLARAGMIREAVLSDANAELIRCYRSVRNHTGQVIAALERHRRQHGKAHYYALRAQEWRHLPAVEAAARMIYLNRTGFNGLYRLNSKGGFNVPMGRHDNLRIVDEENLRAVARVLRGVKLDVRPFAEVLDHARRGDLVYFDPPYVPLSATASFTGYLPGGFGPDDQRRLAEVFGKLGRRGVRVMLSNADAREVRTLYRSRACDGPAYQRQVHANRAINSRADRRGRISELLVRSWKDGR